VLGLSIRVDGLDAQIVELLQEDGRMLYKDIADKVGVSLPTVKARINRLMSLGLIKKFTVVVDSDKIAGKVRGVLFAKVSPTDTEALTRTLSKISEVRAAHFVAGEKQLFLEVEADDVESFNRLILERLPREAGLSDISAHVVTQTVKEEYGVSLKANSFLQYKCNFCHTTIYGKPIVKHYYGGKYYFSGEECAEAYKRILDQKYSERKKTKTEG
jgi:DNA-binding Lrp family transcriptional regulator/YHS domain-containing protein